MQNDRRLIDANALENVLHEKVKTLADENGWHDHYVTGFDDAITYVEDAPTIDAVQVVRCRECWRHQTVNCPMFLRGGDYACHDGFCHMGAKIDGESKPEEPRKICPVNGLDCIECVPGYGCAKMDGDGKR